MTLESDEEEAEQEEEAEEKEEEEKEEKDASLVSAAFSSENHQETNVCQNCQFKSTFWIDPTSDPRTIQGRLILVHLPEGLRAGQQ